MLVIRTLPQPKERWFAPLFDAAGTTYEWAEFNAEHAFARDVGPRWNPAATDDAFAQTVDFFTRILE